MTPDGWAWSNTIFTVLPLPSVALKSTPARTKDFTAPTAAISTAQCKAVFPSGLQAFISSGVNLGRMSSI